MQLQCVVFVNYEYFTAMGTFTLEADPSPAVARPATPFAQVQPKG